MGTRVRRCLIYGLIDPGDGGLRYIGKTHKRKEWRLQEHIECAINGDKRPVYSWVAQPQEVGNVIYQVQSTAHTLQSK